MTGCDTAAATAIAAPKRGLPGLVWLGLLAIAAVIAGVVVMGILSRAAAEKKLADTAKAAAIPTVSVTHPLCGTAFAGALAAGQCAGVCRDADLFPHRRLSEELVFRYRRAREGRATDGGD